MADSNLIAKRHTLAELAFAGAAILVVLVLLLVLVVDHTTVSDVFLLLWGMVLLLSATILGLALAYVFMTRGIRVSEEAHEAAGRVSSAAPSGGTPTGEAATVPGHPPAPEVALRLLSGDERGLYRRIVQAGGAVLQKNLVGEGALREGAPRHDESDRISERWPEKP